MSAPDIPDTWCALPFMAVERRAGRFRPCCQNQNSAWQESVTFEQYWNSDALANLRCNLANGVRDNSCKHCWQQEEQGQMSMRQSVNLSRARADHESPPRLKQVKLITGRTCNLACMMCFSSVSSTYHDVWRSRSEWIMPITKQENLDYDLWMDDFIRASADNLQFIEVLGGEPLFSKPFLLLLQYLVDTQASRHITLYVITNGTIFTSELLDLFRQFYKTVFAISVDGVGPVNEYQRWPSQWHVTQRNLAWISDHFEVSVLPTVTAVNVIGLATLLDYCDSHDYVVNNINYVSHWPQLRPANLPAALKNKVGAQFQNLLQSESDPDPAALLDFVRQWDRQRGINIADYMPEWKDYV